MQWPPTRPGWNVQEVPLGAGGVEHVPDREVELREDLGDLVHEGDVDVALGVLDHLGGLGRLDRGGAEGAGAGHRAVERGEPVGDLVILAGDDLDDPVDRMLAVARIDPLGRIAEEEIRAAVEARHLLDQRPANLLGDAGIDGAFVDDDRLAAPDRAARRRSRWRRSPGRDPGWLAPSTGVGTVTM